MASSLEREISRSSSNLSRFHCIYFRTEILEKVINTSFVSYRLSIPYRGWRPA